MVAADRITVYTISGYVMDVPKGTQVLLSEDKNDIAYTNADGYYEFQNVPHGSYIITPDEGFRPFRPTDFCVIML